MALLKYLQRLYLIKKALTKKSRKVYNQTDTAAKACPASCLAWTNSKHPKNFPNILLQRHPKTTSQFTGEGRSTYWGVFDENKSFVAPVHEYSIESASWERSADMHDAKDSFSVSCIFVVRGKEAVWISSFDLK